MSKKLFSDSEIKMLSKNKYVKKVSSKAITYTDKFKLLFILEYNMGKQPYEIFEDAGFDAEIIGMERIWSCSKRWRKSYKDTGEMGLRDTRKFNNGCPLKRELTNEELLAKKDAEIAYWKAEAELLKKIERKEKQVKNGKLATSLVFKLIQEIISKYNYKNMVRYLCEVSLVSRSGYYNYLNLTDKRDHQEKKDLQLKGLILKAINHRGYKKGSRSIKMVLEQDFHLVVNRNCIQRIMRKYGIICPIRKANPYRRMMKATREHRVVPNLLKREFKQELAGKVLLTDITYMPYSISKMAYLSTIKDGSTNEILSYQLLNRMTLEIATETIKNLIRKNKNLLRPDSFIHSDQGVHVRQEGA